MSSTNIYLLAIMILIGLTVSFLHYYEKSSKIQSLERQAKWLLESDDEREIKAFLAAVSSKINPQSVANLLNRIKEIQAGVKENNE